MGFWDKPGSGGFFEGLLKDIETIAIINATKDSDGKPDPYKAAGALYGLRGDLSLNDMADIGTFLGASGAFDKRDNSNNERYSYSSSINVVDDTSDYDTLDDGTSDDSWRDYTCDNDYGIDPYDYDDEVDYIAEVTWAEEQYKEDDVTSDDSWRDYTSDNAFGIDPYDYDNEEDYLVEVTWAEESYKEDDVTPDGDDDTPDGDDDTPDGDDDTSDDLWHDFACDNAYGIDPHDYDNEEDYFSDVNRAEVIYKESATQLLDSVRANLAELDNYLETCESSEPSWWDVYDANQKRLLSMKALLYAQFSPDYPQLFRNGWDKHEIWRLAQGLARDKQTAHLPVTMLLFLSKKCFPLSGLELFHMLDIAGCKTFEESLYNHSKELCSVISAEKWTDEDCIFIAEVIRYKFLYNNKFIGSGVDLINALLSTELSDSSHDEIIDVVLELLMYIGTRDIRKIPKASVDQFFDLCKKLSVDKKYKEIYKKAFDLIEFEKDAAEILSILRPGEDILDCFNPQDDFISDIIVVAAHSKGATEFLANFDALLSKENMSSTQVVWVARGVVLISEYLAKGCFDTNPYEWFKTDSELKQRIILQTSDCAAFFGAVLGYAANNADDEVFFQYFMPCSELYSESRENHTLFFNNLFENINSWYYDISARKNSKITSEKCLLIAGTIKTAIGDNPRKEWKAEVDAYIDSAV